MAWVIDGYAKYVLDTTANPIDSTATLFHCVWGWAGDSNGYFYFGGDSASGGFAGNQIALSKDDEEELRSISYVFKSVQYMCNFRKKN